MDLSPWMDLSLWTGAPRSPQRTWAEKDGPSPRTLLRYRPPGSGQDLGKAIETYHLRVVSTDRGHPDCPLSLRAKDGWAPYLARFSRDVGYHCAFPLTLSGQNERDMDWRLNVSGGESLRPAGYGYRIHTGLFLSGELHSEVAHG